MLKHSLEKIINYKKSYGEVKRLLEIKRAKILNFLTQQINTNKTKGASKELKLKESKILEFIKIRPALAHLIIAEKDILEDIIFNNKSKYDFQVITGIDRIFYYIIIYINYNRSGNYLTETTAVGNGWVHNETELFEKIRKAYHTFNERYDIDYITIKALTIEILLHKGKKN